MNRIVLDASAILALINREPGQEKLTSEVLSNSVCGAVNLAEVQGKLVSRGLVLRRGMGRCHQPRPGSPGL